MANPLHGAGESQARHPAEARYFLEVPYFLETQPRAQLKWALETRSLSCFTFLICNVGHDLQRKKIIVLQIRAVKCGPTLPSSVEPWPGCGLSPGRRGGMPLPAETGRALLLQLILYRTWILSSFICVAGISQNLDGTFRDFYGDEIWEIFFLNSWNNKNH